MDLDAPLNRDPRFESIAKARSEMLDYGANNLSDTPSVYIARPARTASLLIPIYNVGKRENKWHRKIESTH
jgi:hypothetical protein